MEKNTTCAHCGISMVAKKKTKKYCSTSCRVSAYQERNNIAPPSFMAGYKKTSSPNSVVSREIKRVANEIKVKGTPEMLKAQNRLYELKTAYNNYSIQLHQIKMDANKMLQGIAVGLTAGGASGYVVDKDNTGSWALVGGLVGGIWGANETKLNLEKAKQHIEHINAQLLFIKNEYEKCEADMNDLKNKSRLKDFQKFTKDKIETIELDHYLEQYFGKPAKNFKALIYGTPGSGKSYFAVNLAARLANTIGHVVYNSSEEGRSISMQNKIKSATPTNRADLTEYKRLDELHKDIRPDTKVIFIDSINDMGISPNELKNFSERYNDKAIIYVMQATKDGTFKGDSAFAHDADIVMKVDARQVITEKNRFI